LGVDAYVEAVKESIRHGEQLDKGTGTRFRGAIVVAKRLILEAAKT